MKIAVLMLIHKYDFQQKILIDNLSKDFDLYIHVDKRTKIDEKSISGRNIHVYKIFKVFWGSYNMTPLQKGCDKIRPNCTLLKWRGV